MDKNLEKEIIRKVKQIFSKDYTGHDYFHTERVYRNAMMLASHFVCDDEVIMLAALLHDVDDPKIVQTEDNYNARSIMQDNNVDLEKMNQVIEIIKKISFKGRGIDRPSTLEGQIVQDADRLDALGAIGIARAFAYGGAHQRKMYDPEIEPVREMDELKYRSSNGTTINHFYEKLFLLKDLMNTDIAKEIAEKKTEIMKNYLAQFLKEWNSLD